MTHEWEKLFTVISLSFSCYDGRALEGEHYNR